MCIYVYKHKYIILYIYISLHHSTPSSFLSSFSKAAPRPRGAAMASSPFNTCTDNILIKFIFEGGGMISLMAKVSLTYIILQSAMISISENVIALLTHIHLFPFGNLLVNPFPLASSPSRLYFRLRLKY